MLVGKEFGPYLVEKELGSGAMGTVVLGRHKTSGDRVAIKLMSLALGSSDTAVARFVREVAILKQLDNPNIVKYKGSGRYHKSPFYIMEYVEGESLDHILHRRTRLPWEEVAELGAQLCAGLQHAHDKGIIHRDLKPSNLMILRDGTVKLTDFGIAKDVDVTALTAANSTVGTAAYMSPEQCRGARDISGKTDLYSMGIMFYELLTGRKPFTGETAMEVFLQHANKTDYKRPSQIVMEVPIWLDTLVCQLMEKDPEKRPINANAVAASLIMIKEKVEAQKSAGIEAATKRRIDRSRGDLPLNEEDKETARTMMGKKKKKKKAKPFYTKGWFTITSVGALALGMMIFLYFMIFKAESADSLFARAEVLMKSDKSESHQEARKGPIADFLANYANHEKAAKVRSWADQADFELGDVQLHRRRNTRKPDGDDERLARKALSEEDSGDTREAAKLWLELSKKKGNADPDIHVWGLIGERYLQELGNVDALYSELKFKIQKERTLERKATADDDLERIGLAAVRDELDEHPTQAKNTWEDLTKKAEIPRRWFLLAAKRSHELRDEIEAKKKKDEAKANPDTLK